MRLAVGSERLRGLGLRVLERSVNRLRVVNAQLRGNDPTAILQRGYAIVRVGDRALRDAQAAPPGTEISAQLARGTIRARVETVDLDG
jgi:exonuclease VII large subunit